MIAVVLGALAALPAVARAADAEVTIQNTAFNPQGVTINVGEKVVWNSAEGGHSVTFDDGSFQEPGNCGGLGLVGCTSPGDRIERTFESAGAFKYHCSRHTGMTGLVNVVEAEETTTTTEAPTTTTEAPTTTTAEPTTTTRQLATSSSVAAVVTTTTVLEESTTTRPPSEAPVFDPDGEETATPAGSAGGGGGSNSGAVLAIVAALLAVAGGGGALLWRLRPRSGP